MEHDYTFLISIGALILAEELTGLEKNKERRAKKQRVLDKKHQMLRQAFPDLVVDFSTAGDLERVLQQNDWPQDRAITFIIDLAFINPFAPYELTFQDKDFDLILKRIGDLIGLKEAQVERIRQTQKEAFKTHQKSSWGRIAAFGIGGLVVFGIGGWLLAPVIGSAIGAAAGLYGAAATSHGLAILGGGSLAIGGFGMAGGMWVVAGTGATLGLLGGGGVSFLLELGAARVKIELIKLQVSYKEILLGTQTELKKAQEVIEALTRQQDQIKQQLDEERELNEKNSSRIKEMETMLEALENSLKWIKVQYKQHQHQYPQLSPDQTSALSKEVV